MSIPITIKAYRIPRTLLLCTATLAAAALCGGDTARTVRAQGGEECVSIRLSAGELQLRTETGAFTSPEEWIVADCMLLDIDRDGFDEVLLHVWKPGSFGKYLPFWVDHDDKARYSEHLFLYEWDVQRPDRLDPIWMSSAMPVEGMEVIAEADGTIRITAPDQSVTCWRWGSWGLVLQ